MRSKYKLSLMCAVAGASFHGGAIAQDDALAGGYDDEIVVTATKRAEGLSKVPLSIAAFTTEIMDRRGIRDVEDIALITPGLSFSRDSFGNGSATNIAIRGISSTSGAATTGVYIDDVPIQIRSNIQETFGSGFPKVFDLERIEVLRGPQGTLYGAGSQGGTVRFITPEPSSTEFSTYGRGDVSLTAHGDPSYEAGLAVNFPLIEDRVGLRLSGWRRHEGGYVDRVVTNTAVPDGETFEDANSSNTTTFRAALGIQAADNLKLTPSVYYQKFKSNDTGSFWGLLSDADKGEFINGSSVRQPVEDKFFLYGLTGELDLGPATVTSVTSYFDREGEAVQDYTMLNIAFIAGALPPYPFIPGMEAPGDTTVSQENFTQELRVSSNDPGAFIEWTLGGFYSHNRQKSSVQVEDLFVEQSLPVPLEFIFGIGLTDGRYLFLSGNNSLEKQWAIFGEADVNFTERLSLTLGLRYSKADFDYTRTVGGPINYPGFGPDIQSTFGDQSSDPLTPKIGLNFQIDDNNLVYASASQGFRIGGVNPPLFRDPQTGESCSSIPVPESYGPDSLWSYELGSKNRFLDGAVRTEASVYYIQWDDIQQFVNPGGCAGNGFRDNLGSATSKGFEFLTSFELTENLLFTGTVGYVKATFDDTLTSPAGIITTEGDSLPVTPWQMSAVLDYFRPIGGAEGYFHAEHQYGSQNNGQNGSLNPNNIGYDPGALFDPAVNQTNLRIGWRNEAFDISLYANNVFDEAPLLSRYHDVNASPLYYFRTLRPRTVGLTVTYRR